VFLYLWHVQKTWVANVIKKIPMLENRAKVLFALGEIMYSCGCPIDVDAITWVEQQIHLLATRYPNVTHFMKYFRKHWLHKVAMWCVGNRNILHAGQELMHQLNLIMQTLSKFYYVQEKN